MAFEILHAVKRPTVLKLGAAVDPNTVEAGMAAAVNTSGELVVAGADSAAVVGLFQTQGYVPAYQSTGIQKTQIQGAVGSAGGGSKVSLVAGAGAVVKVDASLFTNLAGAAIGSKVGTGAAGVLKVWASGDVVGLLIGKDTTSATIQMRL
jgi:hypothetical protein